MEKTRKAPLAEILKKAGRASPGCPVFYGISTEEYFSELSRADTSLLMSSSLRAKVEFQRSDPQPLVGMSQCFPSKAMVT